MRTVGIALFEEGEARENSFHGDAVETWKHTSIAQHANVVERRVYRGKHMANCDFCPVHSVTFKMLFCRGGVPGRERNLPTVSVGRMKELGLRAAPIG
jgi:hypothetical protein